MVRAPEGHVQRRSAGAGAGMTRDDLIAALDAAVASGMSREQLVEAIDAAMDATNEEVERVRAQELDDSEALAARDDELVALVVRYVANLCGTAFRRVLTRAAMGAAFLEGEPCPDMGPDERKAMALMLARLVHDMTPLIAPAVPASLADRHRGSGGGVVAALVGDLLELGRPDGASPEVLPEPTRRPGIGNHRTRKAAARRRLVLLVYAEAGRSPGETLDSVRKRLFTVGDTTWEDMRAAVPMDQREAARSEGAQRRNPHPDTRPDILRKLRTQALR